MSGVYEGFNTKNPKSPDDTEHTPPSGVPTTPDGTAEATQEELYDDMSDLSVDLPGDKSKPPNDFEHIDVPTLTPLPDSNDEDLKQKTRKSQPRSSVITTPSKKRQSERLKTTVTPDRKKQQKNLSPSKDNGATDPLKTNNE